jgi:hypothetical protein
MNPLVALAYGALAFSERLAGRPSTLTIGLASLTVVLFGVVQLARVESETVPEISVVSAQDEEEFAVAA